MKHEIEIEGIPEGWEVTNVKINRELSRNERTGEMNLEAWIEFRKTKPRRIVLEETEEDHKALLPQTFNLGNTLVSVSSTKIWRIKEE